MVESYSALGGGKTEPPHLLVPQEHVRRARNPVRGGQSTHDRPHTNRALDGLRHKSARRLGSAAASSFPKLCGVRWYGQTRGGGDSASRFVPQSLERALRVRVVVF